MWGNDMEAKILKFVNSQAVRIPQELCFDVTEVEIFKRGDELVLKSKPKNLTKAFDLLASMPENFMVEGREDAKAKNDPTKSPIITPVEQRWDDWFESEGVSDDFMKERLQEPDQTGKQ